MSSDKKKGKELAAEDSGKTKIFAAVFVLVAIAASAMFFLSGNGVAESGDDLSNIAPASADADAGADAPMIKLGNPVVAVINGEEINRSDVFNFISGLPDQVRQMPIQTLFPLALEQVLNNRVINTKAQGANLEGDPEVEQLLNNAKEQIVRNIYIERQIVEQITQKKLLKSYGELLDSMEEVQETHARHILLETEEKAREIVAKLDEGAVFEDVAKEHSTGPSAENGGDLGFFAKTEMVPEFAEAAFALDVGSYTKDPVKTQFGWHVVKVEDRRKRPEPEFAAVKPQLEVQLRQKILANLLQGWQKESKIKKYDINGETLKN